MAAVRIYRVDGVALPKVKLILEAAETNPEMAAALAQRENVDEKLAMAKKKQKGHADFGSLEAIEDELKAVDKKIEELKAKGALKINEFVRNGYTLRAARGIGLKGEDSYLQIKAPDEDFFKRNEGQLLQAGAKKLEGREFEEVKAAFDKEEESSAAGMGFIFGG